MNLTELQARRAAAAAQVTQLDEAIREEKYRMLVASRPLKLQVAREKELREYIRALRVTVAISLKERGATREEIAKVLGVTWATLLKNVSLAEREARLAEYKAEREEREKGQTMTQAEFKEKQTALLNQVPEEFREVLAGIAWAEGHANGYHEVLMVLEDLIFNLKEPIRLFELRCMRSVVK